MSNEQRIANFEKMAEADPENELAHYSLGKLYFEARRFDDAVASLRRTLELNAEHSPAHQFLAMALLEQKQREEAIELLRAGIEIAHRRGEHMPRNKMIELLKAEGVEPPELATATPTRAAIEGAGGETGFVCRRCGKSGVPLERAPFDTEMGQRIHESICTECWREWMAMSVKVINELRLNLMAPRDSEVYDEHMAEFLGL